MKHLVIIVFVLFSLKINAQAKLKEYTAANGITYHHGDTVKLGMGSMPNGDFKCLKFGGWYAVMTAHGRPEDENIGHMYAGQNLIIREIRSFTRKGSTKVWFVVKGGNITDYNLYIDEAIYSCEVIPCNNKPAKTQQIDIADEIKKLNDLKEKGILTQEEFEAQKKKLLDKQ